MQKQLRQHKNPVWPPTGQYWVIQTTSNYGLNLHWEGWTWCGFQRFFCSNKRNDHVAGRSARHGHTGTRDPGNQYAKGQHTVAPSWGTWGKEKHRERLLELRQACCKSREKVILDKRNGRSEDHKVWNSSVFRETMHLIFENWPNTV